MVLSFLLSFILVKGIWINYKEIESEFFILNEILNENFRLLLDKDLLSRYIRIVCSCCYIWYVVFVKFFLT